MNSLHPLWLVIASLILAVFPIAVGVLTSYLKVSIVLNLLKSGFGAQGVPGATVVMALSFAVSLYVMAPTWKSSTGLLSTIQFQDFQSTPSSEAIQKLVPLLEPWKKFLSQHIGKREAAAIAVLGSSSGEQGNSSFRALLLGFVLTELRQAFSMGFVLLLPFLVIDLIVSNLLVGLGMYMVSPVMIALPLKLILFVLGDGWILLSRSLILSYQVG